jgi:hypothetical protein
MKKSLLAATVAMPVTALPRLEAALANDTAARVDATWGQTWCAWSGDFHLPNRASGGKHAGAIQQAGRARRRPVRSSGGNVSRPRAADDFTTIHARLVELRRERELAAKREGGGDDNSDRDGARLPKGTEGRYRPEKGELPGLGVGRRYLPARQR